MKLPRYVSVFTDRHGIPRFRFRRKGFQSRYLPDLGSKEFEAAYDGCVNGAHSRSRSTKGGLAGIEIKRRMVQPIARTHGRDTETSEGANG